MCIRDSLITDTDKDERFGLARSFFLYVVKREAYEDTGIEATVDMMTENLLRRRQIAAVLIWFLQARASANVVEAPTE